MGVRGVPEKLCFFGKLEQSQRMGVHREGMVGEGAGEIGKSHSTPVKYFSFYPKDKEELLE